MIPEDAREVVLPIAHLFLSGDDLKKNGKWILCYASWRLGEFSDEIKVYDRDGEELKLDRDAREDCLRCLRYIEKQDEWERVNM